MDFTHNGGPMAHIGMLRQTFIEELGWIKSDEFAELFALCQSLPGPTSTQMIIAIGTLVTRSARGGLISFLAFALPAALILLIFGMTFRYLSQIDFKMPEHVQYALDGFQSAAVAIVAQAALKLGQNYSKEPLLIMIMFGSTAVFLLFESALAMILIMVAGGFFSAFLSKFPSDREVKEMQRQFLEKKEEEQLIRSGKGPFGKVSLIIFVALLALFPLLRIMFGSFFSYLASFYYLGSIIIGGGHVILPMILTEFTQYGLNEKLFWNGFAIVSALPGPLFNISIYVGALVDGLVGAFLGWIALFLPAFLMIWGILPYWNKYRSQPQVQKVLKGVGAASVGFIIASVYLLWSAASQKDVITSTFISIGCFVALHVYDAQAPIVILAGGFLMVCRQVVLVEYRGLPSNKL